MAGVDLGEIREQYGPTSGNDLVAINDWLVCVGLNGLIESCTVTTNDPSHAVTGVGLLLYSADGTRLYCSQYTDGFTGSSVQASVSTGSSDLKVGANVLAVVFGYIDKLRFFSEKQMPVIACQQ
jgi:hypothetical protein